ncbi:CHASE2 domain-containing protein [Skermanella sp. TT6]|uniref:histidine kinase n=1 Tax=Skermanella cutis TaxID=2775420 RepID=A0ABX7B3B5_9PROT|nr:CHASE2 domain-containing protein [Skermanella sp. TT6]QQP88598.1 CHASE2 domain-containing protein [Skermanella sp. TT6]
MAAILSMPGPDPGRHARLTAAAALAACLLALRWADPLPLEAMRLQAFDLAAAFCPRPAHPGRVVAVDIDDASLEAAGQWPWPRAAMARLVERMRQRGAEAVVFTVVFAEPDRWSPPRFASVPDLPAGVSGILADLPDTDRVFAESLRGVPVVLARALRREAGSAEEVVPAGVQGRFGLIGPAAGLSLPGHAGVIDNLPVLQDTAAGAGVTALAVDADGVVRRFAAVLRAGGRLLAGLGPETARIVGQASGFLVEAGRGGLKAVRVGALRVPVDADGWFRPRLCGLDGVPVVRAADLLGPGPSAGAGVLEGRIAVVGVSAQGIGSAWRTAAADRPVPAPVLEAAMIGDLLAGRWLHRPALAGILETLAALGCVLAAGLPASRRARFGAALVLAAILAGSALLVLRSEGLLLDWTLPVLAAGLAPVAAGIADRRRERANRRRGDRLMGQVVDASPDPIVTVSGAGAIQSCNAAAAALAALPPAVLAGRGAGPLFGLSPQDLELLIRQRLEGRPTPPVEVETARPCGAPMFLELAVGMLDADSAVLVGRDITRRKLAQNRLSRALADNEALLREIHHRVRNNLQGIWGIIALEKSFLTDATALERLSAIQDRLLVLGRIHEQLAFSGDLARIDIAAQVDRLCRSLADPRLDDGRISLDVRVDALHCHIETALPLGLTIHELLCNSLKFAFPEGRRGLMTVRLERRDGTVVLDVADDGVGLPLDAGRAAGIGRTLLAALASQLEASPETAGPPGHRVRLTMPGRLFE